MFTDNGRCTGSPVLIPVAFYCTKTVRTVSADVHMNPNICKNWLHALILCENRATECNADLLHFLLLCHFRVALSLFAFNL